MSLPVAGRPTQPVPACVEMGEREGKKSLQDVWDKEKDAVGESVYSLISKRGSRRSTATLTSPKEQA